MRCVSLGVLSSKPICLERHCELAQRQPNRRRWRLICQSRPLRRMRMRRFRGSLKLLLRQNWPNRSMLSSTCAGANVRTKAYLLRHSAVRQVCWHGYRRDTNFRSQRTRPISRLTHAAEWQWAVLASLPRNECYLRSKRREWLFLF
jgi:hypothetical protein